MSKGELFILLDFDGVMITTPPWRKVDVAEDGFLKFNSTAVSNLAHILEQTSAHIVLTTTHRIAYNVDDWTNIFKARGLKIASLQKVNDVNMVADLKDRATEVTNWITCNPVNANFIIIDDDQSLNGLPKSLKERWIQTSAMIGLDLDKAQEVLQLLERFDAS